MASRFVLGAGTPLSALLNRGFSRVEERLRSEATAYPTETGADLVDNVTTRPASVFIQAVVSGSDRRGASIRPRNVWQELIRARENQSLLTYVDPFHAYSNLVIVQLQKTQDANSGLGLRCSITLQEILQASVGEARAIAAAPLIWENALAADRPRYPESWIDANNADHFFGQEDLVLALPTDASRAAARVDTDFHARQVAGGRITAVLPSARVSRRVGGAVRPALPQRGLQLQPFSGQIATGITDFTGVNPVTN